MSSPFVWVQLYYEGQNEPNGDSVEIEPVPKNIGALKGLVYARKSKSLQHCDPDDLVVFSPGTTPPFLQDNALDPGETVPLGTTSKNPLIVLAPALQQQPANAPDAMVTLELSLKKKKMVRSWIKEDLTMDSLEMAARKFFKIPLARLAFFLPNYRPLDCDEKLDSIPVNETTTIKVIDARVGFSSISTVKEALQLLCQPGDSIPVDDSIFPRPFDVTAEDEELNHAVSTLQKLGEVVLLPRCETTRRLYIDPILLASARIAGGVLLEVEKEYENRDVHGPIDYIFKLNDQTICVTEGKKDQLDRGVVQNIAQLAAVADDRKRKGSHRKRKRSDISHAGDTPIYGIATTYLTWTFLVLQDGKVTQSSIHAMKDADRDDVGGIIGRIVAILNSCKG